MIQFRITKGNVNGTERDVIEYTKGEGIWKYLSFANNDEDIVRCLRYAYNVGKREVIHGLKDLLEISR